MDSKIQFLEPVDIRQVWSKEDKNFTPWIADPKVITKLLEQCEIEFDGELSIKKEVAVPGVRRKLDVLVETSSSRIAVENQFNEGDHDHMTRALAYAVGLEVKAVIIVAESHRPEFVAVAEYLNAAALAYKEKGIPIFLVTIELFAAPSGDAFHPRFEVVAKPDEWRAAVFEGTHCPATESDRDIGMFNFHDQFLPEVRKVTGMFQNVKPSSNNWKGGYFGLSGVAVTYNVSKSSVFASIWITAGSSTKSAAVLQVLKDNESDIKKILGSYVPTWRVQETSSVDVSIDGIGWATPDDKALKSQLLDVLKAFAQVAKKYEPQMRMAMGSAKA